MCATSLEQVEAAWGFVYDRYSKMGLIDENRFGIHTSPHAVGPHACVILGPTSTDIGYTITLFQDSPKGLALDSAYGHRLDELRRKGRRLLEVGLLADRRQNTSGSIGALFSMMRWAIHYGLHHDLTDIVVGVHPRHASFYIRFYGFEIAGAPTTYAVVKNNPVVLLRLRLCAEAPLSQLPRGLMDAKNNPPPAGAFSHAFSFDGEQLKNSLINGFLKSSDTPLLDHEAPLIRESFSSVPTENYGRDLNLPGRSEMEVFGERLALT